MRRLTSAAALAGIATAGVLGLAPTLAQAAPAAAWTFPTKIANVRVHASATAHSHTVATIAKAGTPVQVTCYVRVSGKVWYATVAPHGFVAGRNLKIPHPHGVKVPPGIPACAA
ncbi:MAG TPA: hypothetical protein VJT31_27570 [Rugosimonospora sp.]|nr:hypothetical protein [Rugosimonospora sp.]